MYHTTSLSKLAVKVNVGHGPSLIKNSSLPPISPTQRKAANLELERMKISTDHILSKLSIESSIIQSIGTDAFINEVRVVLNYWVSRWNLHFHPYLTPSPTNVLPIIKPQSSSEMSEGEILDDSLYSDYGTNQAIKVLHSLLNTQDQDFIKAVLFVNGNALIVNLVESSLLQCTTNFTTRNYGSGAIGNSGGGGILGTAGDDLVDSSIDDNYHDQSTSIDEKRHNSNQEFVQFSSNTGFNNVKPSIWKSCIVKAGHIIDIMDDLHQKYSIESDVNSHNVRLFMWSKLVTLLHIINSNSTSGGLNKTGDLKDWNNTTDDFFGDNYNTNTTIKSKILELFQLQSIDNVISHMEETVAQMEKIYQETKRESLKPNVNTYNLVIGALSRSSSSNSPNRAEWYLRRMEKTEDVDLKIFVEDEDDCSLEDLPLATAYADALSYNLVINAYSSTASIKKNKIDDKVISRAKKADAILQRLEERFNRIKRETSRPDIFSYSSVLHAYANAGKAPEAERILNRIIDLSNKTSSSGMGSNTSIQPNIICFNTVIDAWSKTRGHSSAENAHAILTQMEDLAGIYKDLYPDTISYSSVISAYARSGRDDAGDRAEELLQRSLKLYSDGQDGLKPDSITFITCIDALSKQCLRVYEKKRNITECNSIEERIRSVVNQMDGLQASGDGHVRACTVAYNILLDLFAKTSQVDKAEQLLNRMDEMSKDGSYHVKPDIISYNSVLFALSRSTRNASLKKAESLLESMEGGDIAVKPDVVSYNTVMNGLAKSKASGTAQHVQEIILSMEERYKNKTSQVKPNLITYNICIDAWSKSGEEKALYHVEQILETMIQSDDVRPDVFTLGSVISTIAKSGKRDAPERADSILQRMKDLGVKPNRITYNNLINCWSKSGRQDAAAKAEEILIMMTETNDSEVNPDSITFSSVINCWAQSGEKGSGQRAEKILNLMESNWRSGNRYMKPNRFTYGSVLNAWVKSRDENAVQKTLDVLKRMEHMYKAGNDDARPTEPSYNAGENHNHFNVFQEKSD